MLRTIALVAIVATLASCLELDKVQRTTHFPHASLKHKRYQDLSAEDLSPEAIYYRLLARKMNKLLPRLLREGAAAGPEDSNDEFEKRAAIKRPGPGFDMEPDFRTPSASRYESDDAPSASTLYDIKKRLAAIRKRQQPEPESLPDKRTAKRSRNPQATEWGRDEAKRTPGTPGKAPYRSHRKLPSLERVPEPEKSPSSSSFRAGSKQQNGLSALHHSEHTPSKNRTGPATGGNNHSKRYASIMKRSSVRGNRRSSRRNGVGDLRDIFDGEHTRKRIIRKRDQSSSYVPIQENVTAVSEPPAKDVGSKANALAPETKNDSKPPAEDNDYKFRKWLLDEYYRTMALSFASMRKKRMAPAAASEGPSRSHRQVKRSVGGAGAKKELQDDMDEFEAVENKLRDIEDAMIEDALEIILENAESDSQLKAINAKVANRLDAANDLETVRQSLDHLHDTLENIHEERPEDEEEYFGGEDEEDPQEYEGRWSNFLGQKRSEAFKKTLQEMGPVSAAKRAYQEYDGSAEDADDIAEPVEGLPLPLRQYLLYGDTTEDSSEDECPELQTLSSGCSALNGLFPPEPLQQRFLSACSWHEVCYTCGSVYGLSSDDCDNGFLQEMKSLCSQSKTCNSALVQMLITPLRSKRVFFKRRTLAVCSSDCVGDFLKGR